MKHRVGDSYYNGYVRYIITHVRDTGDYLETIKVTDKYGQWSGNYLLGLDEFGKVTQDSFVGGGHYYYYSKQHFEDDDLFTI